MEQRYPKFFVKAIKAWLTLTGIYLKLKIRYYPVKSVLFVGQSYYHAWYLSRALRKHGWRADVLNWNPDKAVRIYFHGEDFTFEYGSKASEQEQIWFYLSALLRYDVFHFSNAQGIIFGTFLRDWFKSNIGENEEIHLLKRLGKKIVYSNNGCLDGVSKSSFAKWGPVSVCSTCQWRNVAAVCNDELNLNWGLFRNSVTDYQCMVGGNRADYNDDPTVHEVPEFYCLDETVWDPGLDIPEAFRLPTVPFGTVRLYHAVGHKTDRTDDEGVNIKSSHVYVPLVEKLRADGYAIEFIEPTGIPNKEVRFLQAQSDIVLDMLTYGWFGANGREAMMLGKPYICYIRPEWLESVREEVPEYVAELPVISATPDTVEVILRDLISNPVKRKEIGIRSRAFALKWHSAEAGGRRFNDIYEKLLKRDMQLRIQV